MQISLSAPTWYKNAIQRLHMALNARDMRKIVKLMCFVPYPLKILSLTPGYKPPSAWLLLEWVEHSSLGTWQNSLHKNPFPFCTLTHELKSSLGACIKVWQNKRAAFKPTLEIRTWVFKWTFPQKFMVSQITEEITATQGTFSPLMSTEKPKRNKQGCFYCTPFDHCYAITLIITSVNV